MRQTTAGGFAILIAHRHFRSKLTGASALAAAVALSWTPSAAAAITHSSISVTQPVGGFVLADEVSGAETITLTGSSDGSEGERVDINCYAGGGYMTLARDVEVQTGGTFSYTGSMAKIAGASCVLRAVPQGEVKAFPPGFPSPFLGPLLSISLRYNETIGAGPNAGKLASHYLFDAQRSGGFAFGSLGNCAISASALYDPLTLASTFLFGCSGFLWWADGQSGSGFAAPQRSELQIDGQNAYLPGNVPMLFGGAEALRGFPTESYKLSFSTESGEASLEEGAEAVICAAGGAYPPQLSECGEFKPAGVRVYLHAGQYAAGRQAKLTQYFEATDGRSHHLDLLEDNQFATPTRAGQIALPWLSEAFQPYSSPGQALPGAPAGPGSIFLRASAGEGPLGAITFAQAPEALSLIGTTNNTKEDAWLDLHYTRTLPASGTLALGFSYADGFLQSEVQAAASAAAASYLPQITIAAPASGSSTEVPQVTLSGQASDGSGLRGVSVGATEAALRADGSWSATVPLSPGANSLIARATNIFGNSASASVAVDYKPPSFGGLSLRHAAHAWARGIALSLLCRLPAGQYCRGEATLSLRASRTKRRKHHARLRGHAPGRAHGRSIAEAIKIAGGTEAQLRLGLPAAAIRPLRRGRRVQLQLTISAAGSGASSGGVLARGDFHLIALNVNAVEHAIALVIAHRKHLRAKVRCPQPVIEVRGGNFRCLATGRTAGTGGRRLHLRFSVRQLDGGGRVAFRAL